MSSQFCDTSILDDIDGNMIDCDGNSVIEQQHDNDYHSVIIDHELMTGEDEGMILHEDDGLIENNFVDASCLLTDDYVVGGSNDDCNNDLQLSFSSILDEADAKLTAVVESVASSAAASNDNDNTLSPVKALISDNNNQENNNNGSNGCLMVNQMYEEIEGDANGTSRRKKATIVRCEYCGVILKHPSKIQAHMRTHTGEKPFECNICGMRFTQRTPMRMHVRRHIGDTPFKCSWGCGKSFVSNAIKNAHELRIHMGEKRQGPPCPHLKPPRRSIPLRFQTSAEELNLFESTSGTSAEPLIGEHEVDDEEEEDGVDFNDNNFAIVHFEPPLGDIIKQQQIANKRLDEIIESVASGMNVDLPSLRSSRGKRHIAANETTSKTRRSALVAQCEECGLILKHPSKIQAHLRTHTGEKPFECGVCGWRFSTANPLRVHLRRAHTGEKPYECTWDCGRRFVTASARNEHERIVHAGIKRYQCRVGKCRRLFTRRRYLIMHQQKEHLEIDIDNIISFSNYNKLSRFDSNNKAVKDGLVINDSSNKRANINERWSQLTQRRGETGMRISEDEEDEMETSSSDNATVILTNNETVNATKQLNDDNVMNLYGDDGMVLEGGVSAYDELPLYNDDVLIDRDGNNLDDNNMYLDDNIVSDVDGYFNGEVDVGRRMDEMDSGCFNDNNDDEPVIEHRNYLLSTLSATTKRPIIRRIRIIKPSKNVIYSK